MKNIGLPYDTFHSRDIHLYVMSSQKKKVAHQQYTNTMHTRKAMVEPTVAPLPLPPPVPSTGFLLAIFLFDGF